MKNRKRGLGRNLSALLDVTALPAENQLLPQQEISAQGELRYLPVEKIVVSPYQPRKVIDAQMLQELAESIKSQGLIQPIIVRKRDANSFELIAGERRWRACQLISMSEIPAIIQDVSDNAAIAMALIENIQREDLNAIEEAQAIQRFIEEFSMTHQQAAEAIGRSRASVTNLLRLLTLHPEVQNMLQQHKIEMGHARALLSLTQDRQKELARIIVMRQLSVRETENMMRDQQQENHTQNLTSTRPIDPDIKALQNRLSDKIGAKVKLKHQANGKGQIVIRYHSLDELEGILERF